MDAFRELRRFTELAIPSAMMVWIIPGVVSMGLNLDPFTCVGRECELSSKPIYVDGNGLE
jgi:hypothetical protein